MMRCCTALTALGLLLAGLTTHAGVLWEFDTAVEPRGNQLKLLEGTPAFTTVGDNQCLAAGTALSWADAPVLRLRPELEFRCRFRLDGTSDSTQILAMKDGEYILRVDWRSEGGTLSFFVQMAGKWEPRLRGPVVQKGVWYDVRAQWTGAELTMTVNGESFSNRRVGRFQAGPEPLQVGPIAGVIDRLEMRNPGFDRSKALLGLKSVSGDEKKQTEFGGRAGWQGWQALRL